MPSTPGTLLYPAAMDDADSLIRYNNNASVTLTAGINNTQLTIPISSPSSLSASGVVTITDSLTAPTKTEIVVYTSKSGSDLVVPAGGRGAFGSTAQSFSNGNFVEQRAVNRSFTVLADAIIELENKVGIGADLHFNSTTSGTAIANTTTLTSYFTGMSAGLGSTRTITGGITKAGSAYRLRLIGAYATTGSPTGRFQLKIGSVIVADTGAFTLQTGITAAGLIVTVDLHFTSIGVAGTLAQGMMRVELGNQFSGAQTLTVAHAAVVGVIDTTVDQLIDLLFQWGTASTSNTTTATECTIQRIR